ncbi:hypothetical protein FQR65_LT20191 [Abscondita terminalis]|nr:hypothetical protein FQR65_LT20191 [Abscondita terminalis]
MFCRYLQWADGHEHTDDTRGNPKRITAGAGYNFYWAASQEVQNTRHQREDEHGWLPTKISSRVIPRTRRVAYAHTSCLAFRRRVFIFELRVAGVDEVKATAISSRCHHAAHEAVEISLKFIQPAACAVLQHHVQPFPRAETGYGGEGEHEETSARNFAQILPGNRPWISFRSWHLPRLLRFQLHKPTAAEGWPKLVSMLKPAAIMFDRILRFQTRIPPGRLRAALRWCGGKRRTRRRV